MMLRSCRLATLPIPYRSLSFSISITTSLVHVTLSFRYAFYICYNDSREMHLRTGRCALRSFAVIAALTPSGKQRASTLERAALCAIVPLIAFLSQSKAIALRWGSIVSGAASCVDSAV